MWPSSSTSPDWSRLVVSPSQAPTDRDLRKVSGSSTAVANEVAVTAPTPGTDIRIGHASLRRALVTRCRPSSAARKRKTYLKVHGRWCYLYRAIDRNGNLVDVLFSEHRDMAAAQAFFRSAKVVTGVTPDRVTTDGHDSYPRAIRTKLGKGVRHRTSRYLNNRLEIGQSQMRKTDLLARPVRRHHVADLDVAIGDDHAVDQELDQGPPLLEGGLVQALPHPPAELPDGVGQAGEFLPPVRLRHKAPFLFFELPLAPFEVTPAPTVLVQRHHAGEVGVRQALELLLQAHLSTP